MTLFEHYYSEYMNTRDGFDKFHNEVINMPRDEFSNTSLQKIKTLAGYVLLTQGRIDTNGCNYKEVMRIIKEELESGNFPAIRDNELEERYFSFTNLDTH